MRGRQDGLEGVELRRLALKLRGAGLDALVEVGVAAAPNLDEQGVESVFARGAHQRGNAGGRRQRGPQHPQRPDFRFRRQRGAASPGKGSG